jgi:hypothetical protein
MMVVRYRGRLGGGKLPMIEPHMGDATVWSDRHRLPPSDTNGVRSRYNG